ncbi:MAG: MFS transporter, partial [Microbispora sp.]|nr:MFS transporter [Microbispora sp.]
AAGGVLVAALGPLTGLVVNAVCFALGSLIISLALPRGMGRPAGGAAPAASGYWRRFGEGFAFLRGEPLLLTIIVMVGITNLLDAAFGTVLLPVWAERSGNGPSAIGLSNGVWSATAVAGSLVAAAIAHRMPRRIVFFAGFLLAGAPRFLALAADTPMWAVLAVFAVSGAGGGFLNPIIGAIAFERVPPGMRGRVNALGDSLAWAGIPLGGLAAGAAVAAFGLGPALLIGGAAYFLTTNLAALLPQWREMDRLRGHGARGRAAQPQAPAGAGLTQAKQEAG